LVKKTFLSKETLMQLVFNQHLIGAFNITIDLCSNGSQLKLVTMEKHYQFRNSKLQIKGPKRRKSLLDSILINYGVKIDNDEL
jgi:hypothetical protein